MSGGTHSGKKDSFMRNLIAGLFHWKKKFQVFDDDTFLVGYPKSGNTWLQFQMASLLSENVEDVDYLHLHTIVPDIHYVDAATIAQMKRPRVMKSHFPFRDEYRRVIYIVRDPRDVVISYYFHFLKIRKIDDAYPLEKFVERFIKGEVDEFGVWNEHVHGWMRLENDPSIDYMLIRYEDMLSDNLQVLTKVSEFFKKEVSEQRLNSIIQHCSIGNMKSMEKKQINEIEVFKNVRKDIAFVRKGKSGDWRKTLPDSSQNIIVDSWGDLMSKLGYALD